MTNNSPFDLRVDKTTRTVEIEMEFAADRALVWDAFTKQEILDQWYAPKPFISKTKYMDFSVGGKRFYAMVSPQGDERWSVQTYRAINPKTNFKMYSVFADKDENLELPGSEWDLNFSDQDGSTKVSIVITNESLTRLESIIDGFKIGFRMTFDNLTALLQEMAQNK